MSRNLRSGKNEPTANQQSTVERPEGSVGSGGLLVGSWRATIYAIGRRGTAKGGQGCAPLFAVQPGGAAPRIVLPEAT